MKNIKEVLQSGDTTLERAESCRAWLIARGYIYNEIFGWEKIDVLESFNLNPNMSGVPCEMKGRWKEVKISKKETDEFGVRTGEKIEMTDWKRSETELEQQITQNWMDYKKFKKERNEQRLAAKNNIEQLTQLQT